MIEALWALVWWYEMKKMKFGKALSVLKSGELGCVPPYVEEIAGTRFVKWFETPERLSKSFNF